MCFILIIINVTAPMSVSEKNVPLPPPSSPPPPLPPPSSPPPPQPDIFFKDCSNDLPALADSALIPNMNLCYDFTHSCFYTTNATNTSMAMNNLAHIEGDFKIDNEDDFKIDIQVKGKKKNLILLVLWTIISSQSNIFWFYNNKVKDGVYYKRRNNQMPK